MKKIDQELDYEIDLDSYSCFKEEDVLESIAHYAVVAFFLHWNNGYKFFTFCRTIDWSKYSEKALPSFYTEYSIKLHKETPTLNDNNEWSSKDELEVHRIPFNPKYFKVNIKNCVCLVDTVKEAVTWMLKNNKRLTFASIEEPPRLPIHLTF